MELAAIGDHQMKPPSAGLFCPGCTRSVQDPTPTATHLSRVTAQRYNLYCCQFCDLDFWWPRQLSPEIYQSAALSQYLGYHQGTRPFPPWVRLFFDLIPTRSGKLLDVGCGDGAFLARAAACGFETHGIDFDSNSIRVAREKHGLQNVVDQSLDIYFESARRSHTYFDVVCFFEVLEHQAEPSEFLEAILDVLAPGGWIAGSVPNRNRFLAKLDRRLGAGDLPPHHFFWFSARALNNLLTRKGFCDIRILPSGNIGFQELLTKLSRLALSRLEPFVARLPCISKTISHIVLWPVAAFLWLGLAWRPAHLYFQAHLGSNDRP
jgi:2-polyprenyl-3-methyl-5-hydroxy-6-metoxy-1,4-benzoquinol methylase